MIGSLRKQIELYEPVRIADEAGGAAIDFAPFAVTWAAVEHLASARELDGERHARIRRIAVNLRWRADVALGQCVGIGQERFEIVSIESDDAKDRRMTLIAEEARP